MRTSRKSQIEEAIRTKHLVRFETPFEKGPIRGRVLALGPTFFLVSVVSDRIWLNGFECFRISDVRNFEPDPYAPFVEAALKIRGEQLQNQPRIDLSSVESILLTAGREFPLVTIHREKVDPEICWIGHVLAVAPGGLSLLGITPGAIWESEAESFRLSEITRIGFGADYEEALFLVGGDPPQAS